jgi:type IV pilus assembly protein PilV
MKAQTRVSAQRGSFLLEALISVLIVALGILGLIGLQARAIQNVDDAQYRAEAAYMTNALLGQMWVYDRSKLVADFDSAGAGVQYTEFKAWVGQRLPGASVAGNAPVVTVVLRPAVIPPGPPIADVFIQVFWQAPGDPVGTPRHKYEIVATVAGNT